MIESAMRRRPSIARRVFICAMALWLAPHFAPGTAFAQDQSIVGIWSLAWEGAMDNYTGTLNVTAKVKDNLFNAKLNLVKSNGDKITEDATVTVNGSEIRIECSNPSKKGYNPDRFYVVRDGNRMEGYSLDTAGQRGRKIVFNRR